MSEMALLVDIGSTFSKGVLVDLGAGELVATARVPSTVATDVREGLRELRSELLGTREPDLALASSSAAGGLQIVASGLVPSLTVTAARQAALGAGAKVTRTFSYKLTRSDLEELAVRRPDILLLSGGTDGGDEEVVLANARAIAANLEPFGTVIYAGNRNAAEEVHERLASAGWAVEVVANVLPEVRRVDTNEVGECIRRIFLQNIIQAKGIQAAAELVGGVIMPTPSAVMAAASVITRAGSGEESLFESVLVVDVGGATTDVVSVSEETPDRNVVRTGLAEPIIKRTVEGDLGMRHNADTVVDLVGREEVLRRVDGLGEQQLDRLLEDFTATPELLTSEETASAVDRLIASAAISEASRRHAGRVEQIFVPGSDEVQRVRGKDLREVDAIVGTGGPLTSSSDA